MTASLVFYGILGIVSTALAFRFNRHLFARDATGGVALLEGTYYVVGVAALCLGWYFNVRYVHTYHHASYINYIKMLFTNWAADSAAQDYTIVNLVLLPLWTISDGRRRGIHIPWIFFVMSLFTSLAFVERQVRYERKVAVSKTS